MADKAQTIMGKTKNNWVKYLFFSFLLIFLCFLSWAMAMAVWVWPRKPVFYVDYWLSQDMGKIALQSTKGEIEIWDTKSGVCSFRFSDSSFPIQFADFFPGGECFFATANGEGGFVLRLCHLQTGKIFDMPMPGYRLPDSTESRVLWIKDNLHLLVFLYKHERTLIVNSLQFFLLDLNQRTLEPLFKDYFAKGASRFDFSHDKTKILSQGEFVYKNKTRIILLDYSPRIYSFPTCEISHLLPYERIVNMPQISRAADPIIVSSKWVPGDKEVVVQIETKETRKNGGSFLLFWGLTDDGIRIVKTPLRKIQDFLFVNQEKLIGYGENDTILNLDLATKQQALLTGHSGVGVGMATCQERDSFVSCDTKGLLIFWDSSNMKPKNKVNLNQSVLKLEKTDNLNIKLFLNNKHEMILDWNGKIVEESRLINEFPKRFFKLTLDKKKVSEWELFFLKNP